jgi:O-antigen ligase
MNRLAKTVPILTFLSIASILISIAASEIFLGLAFLLWLPIGILETRQRRRLALDWPPFFTPLKFFAAATVLSVWFSENPHRGMAAVEKLTHFFICFLVVRFFDWEWTKRTFMTLFGVGSVAGLFAMGQFLEKWWRFERTGRPADDPTLIFRVTGFMGHWMTFSGEQVLILASLLGCLVFLPIRRIWGWTIATLLVAASVVLSFTRSVWVAALVVVSIAFVWSRKKVILLIPVVVVLLMFAFPNAVHRRVDSFVDSGFSSNVARVQMAKAGWKMFHDHPWFGVGPNRVGEEFREILKSQGESHPAFYTGHLHNNFIQIAAERGIFALLALLWFLGELVFRFIRGTSAKFLPAERRAAYFSALLATVALIVAGMFEYNFGDSEVFILFMFLISAPYAGGTMEKDVEVDRPGASGNSVEFNRS